MKTNSQVPDSERCIKAIRAWQLAILRFAITLNDDDRLALLATAGELDAAGSRSSSRPGFKFFYRTSLEICRAITDPQHSTSNAVLRKYLTRVDDKRLNRAFAAAVAINPSEPRPPTKLAKPGADLWRGLGR